MEIMSLIAAMEDYRLTKKEKRGRLETEDIYLKFMVDYFQEVAGAVTEGRYIVGHDVFCPTEICFAMGITPFAMIYYAIWAAFLEKKEESAGYLRIAAEHGLAPEICSAHRIFYGMTFADIFPTPNCLVWTSQTCDNSVKNADALCEIYNIPGFFLDRPYKYTERSVAYYAEEIRRLVSFLERETGKKIDPGRLYQAVENARQTVELYREIFQLRKAIPSPIGSQDYFGPYMTYQQLVGSARAVEYFKAFRDEIKGRVEQKLSGIAGGEEKYRIFFLFTPPMWDMSIMDWMEEEFGAVVVMDTLSSWTIPGDMDPTRPYASIARRTFFSVCTGQLCAPLEVWVEDALKNAADFGIDGAIFFAHIGCHESLGCIRGLKDALRDQLGVPTIVIECDILDKSANSSEEVKNKLEGFFEILDKRPTLRLGTFSK